MLVEERTRRLISESLVRIHGEEVADGLMTLLPHAECATKQDLELLEARFTARLERELRQVYRAINRQTVAMVIALAGSPLVTALVQRYLPASS